MQTGPLPSFTKRQLPPATPFAGQPPPRCSFNEGDWRVLANYWHPVALSKDVEMKPVAAKLLDVALVVFRTSLGITVAEDRCPHRSTPLHLGMVRNDRLVCSRHGLEYDPLGPCVLIPGQSPWSIPSELRLRTYPVREHLGLVWTCLSAVGANELPEIAEWKDSTYQKVHPPVVEMNASAGRQLEGFLDVAHLPWIHHQTFADRSRTEVPNYDVEKTAYGLQIEYHSPVGNYLRQDGEEVNSAGSALRVWDVYLPLAAKLKAHNAGGANPIVLNIASPVSARKTRLFTAILRNYDQDQPVEPYIDFNLRIFKEDQEIVERQCPEELPLSLHDEVHIRADRASIMYRQELSRLGLGKMFTA